MSAAQLEPVSQSDVDAFVEMFSAFADETERYDPLGVERLSPAETRQWFSDALAEAEQELLWIVSSGQRAGLLMLQRFDSDGMRPTLEIAECYVAPAFRRRGVGRAAVEAVLTRERERGTAFVEAAVLRDNPAIAFWQALGFEVRAYRTARRP